MIFDPKPHKLIGLDEPVQTVEMKGGFVNLPN